MGLNLKTLLFKQKQDLLCFEDELNLFTALIIVVVADEVSSSWKTKLQNILFMLHTA